MDIFRTTTLQLPPFLHGSYPAVERKAKAEGRRCARQYLLNGSFPLPGELRTVAPDEVVFTHQLVDFQDERPAWRLYVYWEAIMSLCESLEDKSYRHIRDTHEAFFRGTAWGALYFSTAGLVPESAERTALRLEAVLRFWDSLQHGRYLYKKRDVFLTLAELMSEACGWAMGAWCPEGGDSVRARLETAAGRMARATREECVEAILRQLPRVLPFAVGKKLRHPHVVTDVGAWREHLAGLDDAAFERISGACPAELLERLYLWDRQINAQ